MNDHLPRTTITENLVRFTKFSALVAIASAFVSFVTNLLLMDVWGVPFSAVATPSDMIVGGAESIRALYPIFVALFSAGVFAIITADREVEGVLPRVVSSIFLCSIICLGFATLSAVYFGSFLPSFIFENWTVITLFLLLPIVYLGLKLKNDAQPYANYLAIAAGCFFAAAIGISSLAYKRYPLVSLIGPSSNCQLTEYVVWAGTSYLVTSCAVPPYSRGQTYFVIERSGTSLRIVTERFSGNL
tara:strand:- start:1 stop:732 length:732 start_codon:yes stop_codon:yes gene_type:complete